MPTTKAKKAKKGKKGKKTKHTKPKKARKATSKKTSSKANKSSNGKKTSTPAGAAKTDKSKNDGKKKAKAAGQNGQEAERTSRDAAPKDKRQLVQERKILRSQSRWLQKALFALGKAEDDHAKLAEVRGAAHEPMAVTIDGTTHQVGAVTDSLRDSVMDRLERLRVTLRNEHSLMG